MLVFSLVAHTMRKKPTVSVIVPVRNNSSTLADCLESLTEQTYKHLEIVVVEDKSTDTSRKIVRVFKKTDPRIKVIYNKKQYGLAVSLNRAIKKSKGSLIAIAHPNSISKKTRIQKQVSFLTKKPKTAAVGVAVRVADLKGRLVYKAITPESHDDIVKELMAGLSMQFETAMINTQLLPKDILYFTDKSQPFIYSEVFIKFTLYGQLANIAQVLYEKRIDAKKIWKFKEYKSFAQVLFTSRALYNYKPSLHSLFAPVLKQFSL